MSGLLTEMAQTSLARLEQARSKESEKALWSRVSDLPAPPRLKLCPESFDIIAECKLHSPSAGDLSTHTKGIESRVQSYAHGGACAVSVLTEPTRFGGNLDHLRQASELLRPLNVPTMRKDFLVDPYQVMEARAQGAGGVLVIVRMLNRSRITELLDCAAILKMFVLLEAFDAADLAIASEILAPRKKHEERILIGLNCRDLEKLTVEFSRLELGDRMPPGYCHVAESGVNSVEDVRTVVGFGYHMALVGTTLMRADHPEQLLSEMLAAGRERAMAVGSAKRADV
ncbi:MAG: indole-3-glycerol phosphate synthase TrpC [Povalibacter sp.]|jgi:indole-3-glycerol phosphate synthase